MSLDWVLDNIIALIANIIALLALFVAGWSAWYTKKYSGQQTEIQREGLEIEKKREREKEKELNKARFDVNLVPDTKRSNIKVYKQLRVTNIGKGDARNVRCTINDIKPSKFPDILDNDPEIDHIDRIRSGTPKVFKIARTKDSDKKWTVKVSWDDRASKNNNDEFELRF